MLSLITTIGTRVALFPLGTWLFCLLSHYMAEETPVAMTKYQLIFLGLKKKHTRQIHYKAIQFFSYGNHSMEQEYFNCFLR